MRVAIVSYKPKFVHKYLKKYGLKESKRPDVVIAFGGEGTFLFAEQKYPKVPKLLLYHKTGCVGCDEKRLDSAMKKLSRKQYKVERHMKIQATVRGKKLVSLNEISIHYRPPRALRFNVKVNGKLITPRELVGDGVIVAAPYGSTAYYYSITRSTFKKGIGIAFNNTTKRMKHKVVSDRSKLEVRILRWKGVLASDCDTCLIPLRPGDVVNIKRCPQDAKIIRLKGMNRKIKVF